MTKTPTHKERTHARILDEAASAMRLHGPDGISVATLMKRAGLTHGGFYAHFPSRDALVTEAIDRMFQDSRLMLEARLTRREAVDGVSELIDWYLSEAIRNAPEQGCPLPALSGGASRMSTEARARFNQGVAFFQRALAAAFEALGMSEPEMTARSVLAEMVGAMSLARAASDEAASNEILRSSRRLLKDRLGLA
jgi:TetR/AcrR family transcriptional regulator, transcriptional repressor for nem operon